MQDSLQITIPFSSNEHATIALQVLQVDKELKQNEVQRTMHVIDNCLIIDFKAVSLRALRTASGAILDHGALVAKTIEQFS